MSDNGEESFDLAQEKIELEDFIIHHGKGEQVFLNMLETCSTVEGIKEFLTVFTKTYFLETSVLAYVAHTHIDHLQGIEKAIDALPDREEFDQVRKQMKDFKTKMRKTSQALKDIIDEAKKRSEHGDDIYG